MCIRDRLDAAGALELRPDGSAILTDTSCYSEKTGLAMDAETGDVYKRQIFPSVVTKWSSQVSASRSALPPGERFSAMNRSSLSLIHISGAKGVGDTAIRNYNKWADIRVNMDTLCENGTPIPTWSCLAAASSTPSSPALWAR